MAGRQVVQETDGKVRVYGPLRAEIEASEARLAERIRAYWAGKGYAVETEIVEQGYHPAARSSMVGTRSDMRNGFPVRRLPRGTGRA